MGAGVEADRRRRRVTIAIVGHGNVGQALAHALRRAGRQVVFGLRSPDLDRPDQRTIAQAAAEAEAVILAVPFAAVAEALAAGGGFEGRVLVDATNPLHIGAEGLALSIGHETSGAERIAALAPGARVFKAFNQTGFENLGDAPAYPARPAMFVAGDDPDGKRVVLSLAADAGFAAIDAGGLSAARLLEPLAMLWIELARKRGLGPDIAFTLQRKG
jgi:8-hydroxy-5-deazaflavin:NADPH oxidoreductase